jgi:hypothetical protein
MKSLTQLREELKAATESLNMIVVDTIVTYGIMIVYLTHEQDVVRLQNLLSEINGKAESNFENLSVSITF